MLQDVRTERKRQRVEVHRPYLSVRCFSFSPFGNDVRIKAHHRGLETICSYRSGSKGGGRRSRSVGLFDLSSFLRPTFTSDRPHCSLFSDALLKLLKPSKSPISVGLSQKPNPERLVSHRRTRRRPFRCSLFCSLLSPNRLAQGSAFVESK